MADRSPGQRRSERASPVDAVVLAGGRARRMAGDDKLVLAGPGGTPLGAVVAAAAEVVGPGGVVVAVGWPRDGVEAVGATLTWAREDPPFGGPFAAVVTALPHGAAETVLVCAGDQPAVSAAALGALVAARRRADADVAVFVDADGRRQPLCAAYRRTWLLARRGAVGDPSGLPARALLDGAVIVEVADETGVTADLDTPDDVARWRAPPD